MGKSLSHAAARSLGELVDRAEITDLLLRYTNGIRRNDATIMASVFADEATLVFPRGPVSGIESIRSYFEGGLGADKARRRGLDVLLDAMSAINNLAINLDGDSAHSEYTAIVITLAIREGTTVLGLSGVRNVDELTRTSGGWRILQRQKVELWEAEVPATSLLQMSL